MAVRTVAPFAAIFLILSFLALAHRAAPVPAAQKPAAIRCLIVGGGPNRRSNPIALENNIAYVRALLPKDTPARILYAGADLTAPIVRVERTRSDGDTEVSYRASALPHVDGPSTLQAFDANLTDLSSGSGAPLLLYFTGHGSPDLSGHYQDNSYELWGENELKVSDLENAFGKLPADEPITLVMVQCFSGAFAQAFFTGSTASHPIVRQGSCGFFAASPEREAAGCTPDVNQADYRDFTTYFFGALSGRDRVGRPVPSADYDHDGSIEMDEAYCYTLGHDTSIDTPMATSDAYVRRFSDTADREIFQTPYKEIVEEATPAQYAALDALSSSLKLTGEDRPKRAYTTLMRRVGAEDWDDTEEQDEQTALWIRFVRLCKTIVLEQQILTSGGEDIRSGLRQLINAEHGMLPHVSTSPIPTGSVLYQHRTSD